MSRPEMTNWTLGASEVQATHQRNIGSDEIRIGALPQHLIILFTKPPLEMNIRSEGVKRNAPPPVGSIAFVPAGAVAAIIDYIMANLDHRPTLERMAELVHLSPDHFARQFKAATGLAPSQFVIARRVERAQELLGGRQELSLAEVAIAAGFSDQSQLCFHFKRIAGVTPGHFRASRIA